MPKQLPRYALAFPLAGLMLGVSLLTAQQPPPPPAPAAQPAEAGQVQELTRGPIHEAFGQPVTFTPEPGPIAPIKPPEPVEELPPEYRPTGENVAWIPGYWHYDEEQKQFLWVSGFWRDLPPGRAWVPGYWVESEQQFVWVHGYWSPAQDKQVEYLPEPPESLEAGPPAEPTGNQIWVPGSWVWQEMRYVWRPGFWSTGYPEWVWVPAHYEWSPLGYVFVEGYWDYPLERRGTLFAPVTFAAYRPGQVYQPRLVVNATNLVYNLFVRPRYHHYFFGDYYAANYVDSGFYPWFAAHNTRYGYDPLYAHSNWVQARQGVRWEEQLRQAYVQRRDQPEFRPARTYAEAARVVRDPQSVIARPLTEVVRQQNTTVNNTTVNNFVRVEENRANEWKQQAREYRKFSDNRRQWEREKARETDRRPPQPGTPTTQQPSAARQAVKVQVPTPPPVAAKAAPARPAGQPQPKAQAQPKAAPPPQPPPLPPVDTKVRPEPRKPEPKPAEPPKKVEPPRPGDPKRPTAPPSDPPKKLDPPRSAPRLPTPQERLNPGRGDPKAPSPKKVDSPKPGTPPPKKVDPPKPAPPPPKKVNPPKPPDKGKVPPGKEKKDDGKKKKDDEKKKKDDEKKKDD